MGCEKCRFDRLLSFLVGFNFGWDAPAPKLRFLCEPSKDMRAIADVYKILSEISYMFSREQLAEHCQYPDRAQGGQREADDWDEGYAETDSVYVKSTE